MVCPRCIMAVRNVLAVQGLHEHEIFLGTAVVSDDINSEQRLTIKKELKKIGFELLDDPQSALVEDIRNYVIEWVRIKGEHPRLSSFLQDNMQKDYSSLSKIFSEVRGMTIERYSILQRVEFIKELLCYQEKTASEIAFETGYSSLAHLSNQFKQVTGMTPSEYRRNVEIKADNNRRFLDEI
jgi:AraC-like DNA-binding protein